jgi:hypothetical protein
MTVNHPPKGAKRPVRPIKTKRDKEGAAEAAKRLAAQAELDAAAEQRLQSLLHELDKNEDLADDGDDDGGEDFDDAGPGRRWSDQRSDRD